jgi:hypothetical protein
LVARNTFGPSGRGVIADYAQGGDPQVGDVTVTDNTQTGPVGGSAADQCYSPVVVIPPAGVYHSGYQFSGNHFLARRYSFNLTRVRNVQISSNTADFDTAFGCSPVVGVNLTDAHTVGIANNVFRGAGAVYAADASSTDITSAGNTTG